MGISTVDNPYYNGEKQVGKQEFKQYRENLEKFDEVEVNSPNIREENDRNCESHRVGKKFQSYSRIPKLPQP